MDTWPNNYFVLVNAYPYHILVLVYVFLYSYCTVCRIKKQTLKVYYGYPIASERATGSKIGRTAASYTRQYSTSRLDHSLRGMCIFSPVEVEAENPPTRCLNAAIFSSSFATYEDTLAAACSAVGTPRRRARNSCARLLLASTAAKSSPPPSSSPNIPPNAASSLAAAASLLA